MVMLHETMQAKGLLLVLCVQMLRDYGQRSCQLLQLLTSSPPLSQASLLDQLSLVHITQDLQQISLLTTQLQVGHQGTLVGETGRSEGVESLVDVAEIGKNLG